MQHLFAARTGPYRAELSRQTISRLINPLKSYNPSPPPTPSSPPLSASPQKSKPPWRMKSSRVKLSQDRIRIRIRMQRPTLASPSSHSWQKNTQPNSAHKFPILKNSRGGEKKAGDRLHTCQVRGPRVAGRRGRWMADPSSFAAWDLDFSSRRGRPPGRHHPLASECGSGCTPCGRRSSCSRSWGTPCKIHI